MNQEKLNEIKEALSDKVFIDSIETLKTAEKIASRTNVDISGMFIVSRCVGDYVVKLEETSITVIDTNIIDTPTKKTITGFLIKIQNEKTGEEYILKNSDIVTVINTISEVCNPLLNTNGELDNDQKIVLTNALSLLSWMYWHGYPKISTSTDIKLFDVEIKNDLYSTMFINIVGVCFKLGLLTMNKQTVKKGNVIAHPEDFDGDEPNNGIFIGKVYNTEENSKFKFDDINTKILTKRNLKRIRAEIKFINSLDFADKKPSQRIAKLSVPGYNLSKIYEKDMIKENHVILREICGKRYNIRIIRISTQKEYFDVDYCIKNTSAVKIIDNYEEHEDVYFNESWGIGFLSNVVNADIRNTNPIASHLANFIKDRFTNHDGAYHWPDFRVEEEKADRGYFHLFLETLAIGLENGLIKLV